MGTRRRDFMASLLQVRNLTVRYQCVRAVAHVAVDGVNFDLAPAEILGLMGESGCGKTTLAMATVGLLAKDSAAVSGSILFRGQELLGLDERTFRKLRGAKISLVAQEPGIALSPVLSVGEQISEVRHAHDGWSWKRSRQEAEDWLARVGLEPVKRISASYPHQLSGGQLQRVVLAQALACRPELVIADEPTASLDSVNEANFLTLLGELKAQLGISVLLISHSPHVQASLADRILVMKGGRIVDQGPFDELSRGSADRYTRDMLGLNPRWATRRQPVRVGVPSVVEVAGR
jgi:ABC-type glutathione transport system ATPase component